MDLKEWFSGEGDMSKRVVRLLVTALVVIQAIFLLYTIIPVFYVRSEKWIWYVNSKGSQIWLCSAAVLTVIWLLDAITKGHTITSILEIRPDSIWQEKLVAALFLLGVGFVVAVAISSPLGF